MDCGRVVFPTVALFFLSGCAGTPFIQDMAYIHAGQEAIRILDNNSGAKVKWQLQVSPAKAPARRASEMRQDQPYVVEPTPIIDRDKLFVHKGGDLLSLDPATGNVIRRYDTRKIFRADVLVDEHVDDPTGDVFSFAYNYELEKYVLFKDDSEVLVQRYGRGDSAREFLDYHTGKLLVGSSFSGVFVFDAFNDKQVWWQPGRSMNKAIRYQRLEAMKFDRQREVICALYRTKKASYFLETYKFNDGKSLWKKDISTQFPGKKAGAGLFIYGEKLVFTEGLPEEKEPFVNSTSKTFDILTGEEGPAFDGAYGMGWRDVDGGLYYTRYDQGKAKWRGFIQGFAPGEPREVAIEGMDPAFGLKQVNGRFIYFSSRAGDMSSTISPDDREIHLSGYSGIGTADSATLKTLWHVDVDRQKAMPTLYEKEDVIVLGDPMGKGKTSDLTWLYSERFGDTGIVMDVQTGKVLWKAKIEGGQIARMTVWNNMAFIKTLGGNLFAVQWNQN